MLCQVQPSAVCGVTRRETGLGRSPETGRENLDGENLSLYRAHGPRDGTRQRDGRRATTGGGAQVMPMELDLEGLLRAVLLCWDGAIFQVAAYVTTE